MVLMTEISGQMPHAEWTTPDQKAFLESKYDDFLKAQVEASVTQFWVPVFSEWFKRFPEELAIFGEMPEVLSEEQNRAKGTAVDLRQKKIKNWFNYRSQKSGRSAVNAMGKTIRQMLTNKAKGTRVHTEAEVFSKMRYSDDVQAHVKESIVSGSLATKSEKLGAVRLMTRRAYEDASEDVKALCRAKVQEEWDAKASEVLKQTDRTPTNAQYARALTECMGPISHFMQVIKDMTGWEWSLIGAGPDPHLDGNINAMSYHSGVNATGLNWKQATPRFNETHLKAYVDFISTIFPPHIRKTRALNYDASASTSSDSESPASGSSLDAPTTASFQSQLPALPAPTVLPHPDSSTAEHYDLQSSDGYHLQDNSSISFFTDVPNVGLHSSRDVSFMQDTADSSSSFLDDIPKVSFDMPNWENPQPLLGPLLHGSTSRPNGSTSTSTWETPPILRSFLSTSQSFPPALQLSPIAPHLSHLLPSFQQSMATPQFTFPSLPAAPVVAEETPHERDVQRTATPLPSVTPLIPVVAEEMPDDTSDVAGVLPGKALGKVKRKRASKAINKVMEVVESTDSNALRKTGRIRQESTRMAQANQIGQSNKRARTRR
ncbi:hypothetical protein EV424DRAFT_1542692 [Suillus variegatus]|nr:hypothetical protein EV424DRAFT_1542692 [Suillus variegatus]